MSQSTEHTEDHETVVELRIGQPETLCMPMIRALPIWARSFHRYQPKHHGGTSGAAYQVAKEIHQRHQRDDDQILLEYQSSFFGRFVVGLAEIDASKLSFACRQFFAMIGTRLLSRWGRHITGKRYWIMSCWWGWKYV